MDMRIVRLQRSPELVEVCSRSGLLRSLSIYIFVTIFRPPRDIPARLREYSQRLELER
jgi:hypothetical protein